VQGFLNHDARACGTHLAGVHKRTVQGVIHRSIEIRVGENDVGVLAAQF